MKNEKIIIKMMSEDNENIVDFLDGLKSSYALEYVIKALKSKSNKHTLDSFLKLIRKSRKNSRDYT